MKVLQWLKKSHELKTFLDLDKHTKAVTVDVPPLPALTRTRAICFFCCSEVLYYFPKTIMLRSALKKNKMSKPTPGCLRAYAYWGRLAWAQLM